ncbi:MAG: hypothetical protein NTY04_04320 [Candidatus Staskawiczbacteria bacterium]|nr:hypothetical protein [Candidatus Staskawiczbacteria bacterium]
MPKENIDSVPAIVSLNQFAEKLPPEHREKLYSIVHDFLAIGGSFGVFAGLAGAVGTTSEGDQQREWMAYLAKKADESRSTPVAT